MLLSRVSCRVSSLSQHTHTRVVCPTMTASTMTTFRHSFTSSPNDPSDPNFVDPRGTDSISFELPGIPSGGASPEELSGNVPAIAENVDMKNITLSAAGGGGGRSSVSGVRATVFGASSNLGKAVINLLAQMGSQVVLPFRGDGTELRSTRVMGDLGQCVPLPYQIRDKRSVERVIEESNVVINCIGNFRETRNFSYHDTHVNSAHMIARTAAELGVDRMIHVSAMNASPDNPCEFYTSKYHGEEVIKLYYPEATIIRPSYMFGFAPDHFFQPMARQWWKRYLIPSCIGPDQLIQPCHYIDTARAILKCVLDPVSTAGNTYNIYGDIRATRREFFERVRDCMACSHWSSHRQNYYSWSPYWGALAKYYYKNLHVKYNVFYDFYRGPLTPYYTKTDYELCLTDVIPNDELDAKRGLKTLKDLGLKPEDYFYWEAIILEPWHLHGQEEYISPSAALKNGYGAMAPVSHHKSINYAWVWGFRWTKYGLHAADGFHSDKSEREKWSVGGEQLNRQKAMA